jgi:hypothetical protein
LAKPSLAGNEALKTKKPLGAIAWNMFRRIRRTSPPSFTEWAPRTHARVLAISQLVCAEFLGPVIAAPTGE